MKTGALAARCALRLVQPMPYLALTRACTRSSRPNARAVSCVCPCVRWTALSLSGPPLSMKQAGKPGVQSKPKGPSPAMLCTPFASKTQPPQRPRITLKPSAKTPPLVQNKAKRIKAESHLPKIFSRQPCSKHENKSQVIAHITAECPIIWRLISTHQSMSLDKSVFIAAMSA